MKCMLLKGESCENKLIFFYPKLCGRCLFCQQTKSKCVCTDENKVKVKINSLTYISRVWKRRCTFVFCGRHATDKQTGGVNEGRFLYNWKKSHKSWNKIHLLFQTLINKHIKQIVIFTFDSDLRLYFSIKNWDYRKM